MMHMSTDLSAEPDHRLLPSPQHNDKIAENGQEFKGDDITNLRAIDIEPQSQTQCTCQGDSRDGPYYTHLGAGSSLAAVRALMEARAGVTGSALRITTVRYTGKEGSGEQGCPSAKWVIHRSSPSEKVLLLVRHRPGHVCQTALIVVCIVCWDGVSQERSTQLYDVITRTVASSGVQTHRGCATNKESSPITRVTKDRFNRPFPRSRRSKPVPTTLLSEGRRTCLCQGVDEHTAGASFTFGCGWSGFYGGCKFARSGTNPKKFRLKNKSAEPLLEEHLQNLATELSPLHQALAPQAYKNMTAYDSVANSCRLGTQPGQAFSAVTACLDFSAHSHKDVNNMTNGCSMVVTLTKSAEIGSGRDRQLHTLPLYMLDQAGNSGTSSRQELTMVAEPVEILTRYSQLLRITRPRLSKKKAKKASKAKQASKVKGSSGISTKGSPQLKQVIRDTKTLKAAKGPQGLRELGSEGSTAVDLQMLKQQNLHNKKQQRLLQIIDMCRKLPLHLNYIGIQSPCRSDRLDSELEDIIEERSTDNLHLFQDGQLGGVGIELTHGSVLFEYARVELHASTALQNPNRHRPMRIALVFYQHKNLNLKDHGMEEFREKNKVWQQRREALLIEKLSEQVKTGQMNANEIGTPRTQNLQELVPAFEGQLGVEILDEQQLLKSQKEEESKTIGLIQPRIPVQCISSAIMGEMVDIIEKSLTSINKLRDVSMSNGVTDEHIAHCKNSNHHIQTQNTDGISANCHIDTQHPDDMRVSHISTPNQHGISANHHISTPSQHDISASHHIGIPNQYGILTNHIMGTQNQHGAASKCYSNAHNQDGTSTNHHVGTQNQDGTRTNCVMLNDECGMQQTTIQKQTENDTDQAGVVPLSTLQSLYKRLSCIKLFAGYSRDLLKKGRFPKWSMKQAPGPDEQAVNQNIADKLVAQRRIYATKRLSHAAARFDNMSMVVHKRWKTQLDRLSGPQHESLLKSIIEINHTLVAELNANLLKQSAKLKICPELQLWTGIPQEFQPADIRAAMAEQIHGGKS